MVGKRLTSDWINWPYQLESKKLKERLGSITFCRCPYRARVRSPPLVESITAAGSPWSSLCVSLRASTPEGAPGGPAQLGQVFSFFFYFFFCKFWNIRWIKKCSDSKNLFWKTVQIKTCSIRNLFNFEFHVQIRKICSNLNLFKLEFVQTRICSNSNLFSFEFVQTWFCSYSNLFKLDFVQIQFFSNLNLFKNKTVQK
jgi:hypothetical protein